MRTKRFIRLKEIAPLVETYHTPTPAQVECSDESLIVQPYLCRTDKDGYMMNGNGIKSGLRSIVFMGDSFVESMYSEETDRFVSQTERLLEVGGERFQCLNAGYSGSSTLQIVNSLINKVYPTVGPNSYVVLQVPHSDRDYIHEEGSYWNQTPRGATILPASGTIQDGLPVGSEATRTALNLAISTAWHLKIKLILATTPFRRGDFNSDAPLRRIYRRNADRYQTTLQRRLEMCQVVRAIAAESRRVSFLDGEAALSGSPEYFQDELHLNRSGQNAYAAFLARSLKEILS